MSILVAMVAFATPLAAAVEQPPLPTGASQHDPQQDDTFTFGWPVRALPFRLNLDRGAGAPQSLQELVDRIYEGLPEDRLEMFAAYHGSSDFERMRAPYDSTVDFYRDLHTIEILYEADRIWGFDDDNFPLDAARRCVGDDYVRQVAIQIGVRRLYEVGSRGIPAPLRDMKGAYIMADRFSRRLFALCDQLNPASGAR